MLWWPECQFCVWAYPKSPVRYTSTPVSARTASMEWIPEPGWGEARKAWPRYAVSTQEFIPIFALFKTIRHLPTEVQSLCTESSEKGHITHWNHINMIFHVPTCSGMSQTLVRITASINQELRVCQDCWGCSYSSLNYHLVRRIIQIIQAVYVYYLFTSNTLMCEWEEED